MSQAFRKEAVLFVLWARLFSPVSTDEDKMKAWDGLGLPSDFVAHQVSYWSTFHVGHPSPPIPLLLHAALDRDGSRVREDCMRIADYLGLESTEARLPPDHLAGLCEILALLIEGGENVLSNELKHRYLIPWCEVAATAADPSNPVAVMLPKTFREDLARCLPSSMAAETASLEMS